MSEFKFACPVCGQHITAAKGAAGTKIECPTCFRKIVVPQAAAAETKLILSAAQADGPRTSTNISERLASRPPKPRAVPALAFALVLLGILGVCAFFLRDQLFPVDPGPEREPPTLPVTNTPPVERVRHPVPTNIVYTLNLGRAAIPDSPVRGRIRGEGFHNDRASISGTYLTLRQGKEWPGDLGLSIHLPGRNPEDLAGKTFSIGPKRLPPMPRVILRWRDEQMKLVTQTITNGYALNLSFGQIVSNRLPGSLYLALPDQEKSFVAGKFEANIRAPTPRKKEPGTPGGTTPTSGSQTNRPRQQGTTP